MIQRPVTSLVPLFERAQVAAPQMTGWSPRGDAYQCLVFANEPVERLTGLDDRFPPHFRIAIV